MTLSVNLGLRRGSVTISEYDLAWPQAFAVEAVALRLIVGEFIREIYHFGSTSVPGAAAKPIIDIAAVVPELSLPTPVLRKLQDRGYGLNWIHVLPDRICLTKGTPVTHHLYLVTENCPTLSRWLSFRDALRASARHRRQYESLKRKLGSLHPHNRMAYTEGKSEFVQEVLEFWDHRKGSSK